VVVPLPTSIGPEFKPQYHIKKERKRKHLKKKLLQIYDSLTF
jgi:hypothetical protein